jgi:hypothetical protein
MAEVFEQLDRKRSTVELSPKTASSGKPDLAPPDGVV